MATLDASGLERLWGGNGKELDIDLDDLILVRRLTVSLPQDRGAAVDYMIANLSRALAGKVVKSISEGGGKFT